MQHHDNPGNSIEKLHRTKRKVMNDDRLLWPDGIVYYLFDGSHSKQHPILFNNQIVDMLEQIVIKIVYLLKLQNSVKL